MLDRHKNPGTGGHWLRGIYCSAWSYHPIRGRTGNLCGSFRCSLSTFKECLQIITDKSEVLRNHGDCGNSPTYRGGLGYAPHAPGQNASTLGNFVEPAGNNRRALHDRLQIAGALLKGFSRRLATEAEHF